MYFLDLGSKTPSSTPLLARVSWSHEEYFRALYLRETEKRERERERERGEKESLFIQLKQHILYGTRCSK